MIRKVGDKYIVVSEEGKPLSKPLPTREAAEKRLRQIEYFKYKGKKK